MSLAHLTYVPKLVAWYQQITQAADTTGEWIVLPSTNQRLQVVVLDGQARVEMASGTLADIEAGTVIGVPMFCGSGFGGSPPLDFRSAPYVIYPPAAPVALRVVTPALSDATVSVMINADLPSAFRDRRHA